MNNATPEPNALLQFWLILLLVGNVVSLIVTTIVAITNRKQKREVNFAFEPASKVEFDKHVVDNRREHENFFSKIGGVDRGNGEKISREVGLVHTRINELDKSVGALEATTELQNQTLSSINADVKRILERMPRTH